MSQAEATARKLYETMHLSNVSDEVKRHLMILMLSSYSEEDNTQTQIPQTLQEAMSMGAMDIESARKDLHTYVDTLAKEYHLR